MVRVHPDPPGSLIGGVAQLGEHLLCKQGVIGSIPFTSTNRLDGSEESPYQSVRSLGKLEKSGDALISVFTDRTLDL